VVLTPSATLDDKARVAILAGKTRTKVRGAVPGPSARSSPKNTPEGFLTTPIGDCSSAALLGWPDSTPGVTIRSKRSFATTCYAQGDARSW